LYRAGRGGEAVDPLRQAAAVSEAIPDLSLEGRFDQACGLALLASAGSELGPGAAAEAESARNRAMGALKAALASGFRADPVRIRDYSDLAALRDRADFSWLLLDVAMPADAFARGQ